jgi:hypothetical protein
VTVIKTSLKDCLAPKVEVKITDVESLSKSLNLRKFVRANKTSGTIKLIQNYCLEQISFSSVIQQEYGRITSKQKETTIAQISINN